MAKATREPAPSAAAKERPAAASSSPRRRQRRRRQMPAKYRDGVDDESDGEVEGGQSKTKPHHTKLRPGISPYSPHRTTIVSALVNAC